MKECKTCRKKHQGDYWYLRIKYFICHNMRHIIAKYLEKSNSRTPSSQTT